MSVDVLRQQLRDEFNIKFASWRRYPSTMDWSKVDGNVSLRDKAAPDMLELMGMDIGAMYNDLSSDAKYGHFPAMAASSKGQLGALNAESFCERCLSCANLVVTDGNTLLLDEEVTMLVILRMNVKFMEFMRANYGSLVAVKQRFNTTVVD